MNQDFSLRYLWHHQTQQNEQNSVGCISLLDTSHTRTQHSLSTMRLPIHSSKQTDARSRVQLCGAVEHQLPVRLEVAVKHRDRVITRTDPQLVRRQRNEPLVVRNENHAALKIVQRANERVDSLDINCVGVRVSDREDGKKTTTQRSRANSTESKQ